MPISTQSQIEAKVDALVPKFVEMLSVKNADERTNRINTFRDCLAGTITHGWNFFELGAIARAFEQLGIEKVAPASGKL